MHATEEFQYLTVLISIVLGLGITQLLTGIGRLAQARGRVRLYWPAALWVGLLFLVHVQSWWAIFALRDHRGWTFLAFLVVLMTPTSLYLMAALALPDIDVRSGESVDLRAHYYAQARWFFGAVELVILSSLLRPLVFEGRIPLDLDRGIQGAYLVLAGVAMVTRREAFHRAFALVGAGLYTAYVTLLFTQLR
ncbi:MAG TPA: hypothetical protein VGD56_11090 [Gemmatirosa sp.]